MTAERFINEIQGYYGDKYSAVQLKYIMQYLSKLNERALDHLFGLTLRGYSGRYGKAPDIAVFEDMRPKVLDSLEDEGRRDVLLLEDQSELASPEEVEEAFRQLRNMGML